MFRPVLTQPVGRAGNVVEVPYISLPAGVGVAKIIRDIFVEDIYSPNFVVAFSKNQMHVTARNNSSGYVTCNDGGFQSMNYFEVSDSLVKAFKSAGRVIEREVVDSVNKRAGFSWRKK